MERMSSCSFLTVPVLFAHTVYRMCCCENPSIRILIGAFGVSQMITGRSYTIPCSYIVSIAYLRAIPSNSGLARHFLAISIPLNMISVSLGYKPGFISPVYAVAAGSLGASSYLTMLQIGALGASILSSTLSSVLLVESFMVQDGMIG